MRIFYVILFSFILFSTNYVAKSENGIALGIAIKPTTIDGKISLVSGFKATYIYDHSLYLGFGYYNLITNNIEAGFIDDSLNVRPNLRYDYFGPEFEYVFNPDNTLNFSIMTLVGMGHVKYGVSKNVTQSGEEYYPEYSDDWFYVLEPAVNINYQLTTWMRLSANAGYRLTFGGNYTYREDNYGDSQLSGFTLKADFMFGIF